jgi:signal peptidase I
MKSSTVLEAPPVRGGVAPVQGGAAPFPEGPADVFAPLMQLRGGSAPCVRRSATVSAHGTGAQPAGGRSGRPAAWPARHLGWLLAHGLLWAVAGFVVGLLVVVHGSALFGYRSLVVLSGSMAPTLATGDLVIEKVVRARDLQPGDIVSFRDPDDLDEIVTHRLLSTSVEGAEVVAVTKGDANTGVENWSIGAAGRMGRVVVRVPYLGYTFGWMQGPAGRVLLVVLPALLLGGFAVGLIWRSPVLAPWRVQTRPVGDPTPRGEAPVQAAAAGPRRGVLVEGRQ